MNLATERRLERALASAVLDKMADREVTLRGLARESGVPLGTLHNWLGSSNNKRNRGRPRLGVVVAVTTTLGISLDDVVALVFATS